MKLSTKCKVRLNIMISISIEMLHLDFKWRVHAKKDLKYFSAEEISEYSKIAAAVRDC